MLAHSDETDDSNEFSQSHPGCSVVPATLAAGERFGIDGTRFLRAVVLGYDIGPRMTISFGAVKFRNTSRKSTHAIAGIFGSAAAAGCAAGLTAQQMRWLLDDTAQQSSALLQHAGFNGIDDILSGADNYFLAYAPDANPQELVKQFGERYEITRTNIKKWTVGSPIQAPLAHRIAYSQQLRHARHLPAAHGPERRARTRGAGAPCDRRNHAQGRHRARRARDRRAWHGG
jgi:2-methylcitrate dehydratase PrpD